MIAADISVPQELLPDVKNYLDITWEDAGTEQKLVEIITRGILYIDSKAGSACDYLAEGLPRGLLFDFARYAMADALHDFEKNYLSEITSLRLIKTASQMV